MNQTQVNYILNRAASCVILSEAGPRRSHTVGILVNYPRIQELPCYELLLKIHNNAIVSEQDIGTLEQLLQPHQKIAADASGMAGSLRMTPIQLAMVQHNLLAISGIYDDISFETLSQYTGLTIVQVNSKERSSF